MHGVIGRGRLAGGLVGLIWRFSLLDLIENGVWCAKLAML